MSPSNDAIKLFSLHEGQVLGHNDEVTLVAKPDWVDAIKLRMGRWLHIPTGWLGLVSYNLFEGSYDNPRQYEKAIVGVCHDDDYPKDVEAFEWRVMLHHPGARGDMSTRDNCMIRVTHRFIEVFGKKVYFNDNEQNMFAMEVTKLYIVLLGRNPESLAVIEEWRRGSGGNLDIVRQGIMDSPEYQDKHK